ncbi:hypothetical protein A9168_15225 [Macellibacteroides sp. HH-ZS]|nr:hypothetical protein A9168_15225 [Macellibacteroides sp. HH-ZS]
MFGISIRESNLYISDLNWRIESKTHSAQGEEGVKDLVLFPYDNLLTDDTWKGSVTGICHSQKPLQ